MKPLFGPLLDAIFTPSRCFTVLAERPSLALWILLWLCLVSFGHIYLQGDIYLRMWTVGGQESIRQQAGENLEAELLESREAVATMANYWLPLTPLLSVLLPVLLFAVLIWAASSVLGGSTDFRLSAAVASAAAVITPGLYTVYVTLVWWLRAPEIRRSADIALAMPTAGIDLLFLELEMQPWLRVLLAQIGLFAIWWVVLLVMGGVIVLGLSRGKAIFMGVVLWVAAAVVPVLSAVLGG